jgi:arylsulfatase A-like enzyme
MEIRERYGMHLFGQATLAGRRLLEAGSTLVSVFWDEYGPANSAWDTHFRHYERLKDELLPGLDAALTALLTDLEDRGMLDDTLVLCLTEHGRTPKITLNTPRGVGREHWSNVYSTLLAGGGITRGNVIGVSDREGAFVKDNPISPKDVLCTIYHLLGVDPHTTVPDVTGRPYPLVAEGRVVTEMLG